MTFGAPTQTGPGLLAPDTIDSKTLKQNFIDQSKPGTADSAAHLDPNQNYNPPFDHRIWQQPPGGMGAARAPKLLRGRLSMWERPNRGGRVALTPENGASRSLNFLYNPTTISHSFAFNADIPPPDASSDQDVGVILMQGQSVNFRLIFDRQYDSAYSPEGKDSTPGKGSDSSGVLADTTALQYMLGTYNGEALLSTFVLVMFGATKGNKPFGYFGYIIGCEINYLMFNHRMIPTRCEVDITLARRFVPDALSMRDPATREATRGVRARAASAAIPPPELGNGDYGIFTQRVRSTADNGARGSLDIGSNTAGGWSE
jgi:hypothetical protein